MCLHPHLPLVPLTLCGGFARCCVGWISSERCARTCLGFGNWWAAAWVRVPTSNYSEGPFPQGPLLVPRVLNSGTVRQAQPTMSMEAILGIHLDSDGSTWILKMCRPALHIVVPTEKIEVTLSYLAHSEGGGEIRFFLFVLLLGFVLFIFITVFS